MKIKKWYRVLPAYFFRYRFIIVMLTIFTLIFGVIFWLYKVPTDAVFYAFFLCLLVSGIMAAAHFIIFYKKYIHRQEFKENISLLTDELPHAEDIVQEDLVEMIDILRKINIENKTQYQEQRNDSIDYFSTWVHQIKTPIAVMKMILQGEDTDEHRELLGELFRIEQYTEMTLSYFRLDSSSSDFVIKKYDIDDIVRSVIHKYASQFIRKRIQIKYTPVHIDVLTDQKWLAFIIEQIMSNAVKYTETGSVSINVTEDKVLSITDTGIGISAEDIPRIFEKGFTGYNGRENMKSTGIGLYLCSQAAKKLSHRISVESEVGVGTTFYIDMKVEEVDVE